MGNTLDQFWVARNVWKPDLYKDKVVFATGGSGTIVRVQVEALVLLGANAVIIGRNAAKAEAAAKEIESLRPGAKVLGLGNVDVRSVQSLKQAADTTVEKLGRIDFVICGAAGNFISSINALSANAFKSVIDIDLLGSFNTVKACYDQLTKNKGSIIFVSATLHYYGVPFQAHVGAAKAGVDALSNALAVELGPACGIRSNCIAPGAIANTEGMARLAPPTAVPIEKKVPLQRLGTTEDIADATVFLFSPAASYITGEVLVVDGGLWQVGSPVSELYPKAVVQMHKNIESKL
ncbi:uncharacterized protein J8A68_001216 [[Candida] subhashii]|uniref:2,4-dienoyl-CoA reductase [(3E)-enoyl-CoA-producing] n=1 Tax=[Candida] subhashii TaxID=561895 RepID=A0A8J5QRA5_9ASCO|nr:uncharacterized protein J8A68_001216 [[Candida] subhashii]KAG7665160.1 hypothetical protein J8A68_001216 [[Candida] subhashii]